MSEKLEDVMEHEESDEVFENDNGELLWEMHDGQWFCFVVVILHARMRNKWKGN